MSVKGLKENLYLLIQQGESYNLEFKESFTKDIGREICAFANANGGKILLGVSDDSKITGISITNRLKAKINDITRNFDPKFRVILEEVDNVLIVIVPEGDNKPYSVSGKFYIRIGTNSQKMERKEIKDFFISEGLIHFDEKPNPEFDIQKDINTNALQKFRNLSNISDVVDNENLIDNLYLIKDGKIKNAGVLIFCKNISKFFNYATINCILFQGKAKVKILDRKEYNEDLYTNYQKTINYLKEKLNTEYIINDSGPRKEKLELPEEALREAILNAIGHRDYFKTTSIYVEIYHDRVEITNPGGLVKGLSKKDLGKKSFPRNNLLFGLFQRMHIVEKAGTGIARMKIEMQEYNLPEATIETDDNWFTIIFQRPTDTYEERLKWKKEIGKKFEKTVEKTVEKAVGKTVEKIITLIKENPNITIKELSNETHLTRRGIEWNIKNLKDKGLLKRIGPAKGGHWKIIENLKHEKN